MRSEEFHIITRLRASDINFFCLLVSPPEGPDVFFYRGLETENYSDKELTIM